MSDFDVVVVGSLNMDLVGLVERQPGPGETVNGDGFAEYPGGKGLNQAVSAARSGARVAMVGAIGDDEAGATLREIVRREGIDDSLVATVVDIPTGRAMITVDRSGENSIVVFSGANAAVTVGELPPARVVLSQLETNVGVVQEAFRQARGTGARTVLNPAPAIPLREEWHGLIDVLVPNEHEVEILGGAGAVSQFDIEHLVITRGASGTDLATKNRARQHLAPFPVDPVDTTGAGDAFCGALASRLALGDEMPDALRYAAAAGALATTRRGAVPSQPTRLEIERVLAAHPSVSLSA